MEVGKGEREWETFEIVSTMKNLKKKLSVPAARQNHPSVPLWPGLLSQTLFAGYMNNLVQVWQVTIST